MFYTPTSITDNTAITINSPGEVMVDLKGYTLTGPPQAYAGGYYLNPCGIKINSSNVTIKNGTIAGFSFSVKANENHPNNISNIDIRSITCNGGLYDSIELISVNNSIVRDCSFNGEGFTGIIDSGSQTGNRYIHDTFRGPSRPIDISYYSKEVPLTVTCITSVRKDD
jgi:hypothetical protein